MYVYDTPADIKNLYIFYKLYDKIKLLNFCDDWSQNCNKFKYKTK